MQNLNYNHLRYFWAVVREGGLRQASERLRVTQPTISAQITALEDSLGEKLFRRSGRRSALTDAGRQAFEVAEQIFPLGQELLERVRGSNAGRRLRLLVGIADSLPKLLCWGALEPATRLAQKTQLSCHEGHSLELLARLALGKLDVVLSDEPAPSSLPIKVFTHELGVSATTLCAVPELAERLREGFPGSLNGAPLLLPMTGGAWRHALDAWLEREGLRPEIVGEFEDAALMKVAAASGLGVAPVPLKVAADAQKHYGLAPIHTLDTCVLRYYAITAHRRVTNPAVAAIMGVKPALK